MVVLEFVLAYYNMLEYHCYRNFTMAADSRQIRSTARHLSWYSQIGGRVFFGFNGTAIKRVGNSSSKAFNPDTQNPYTLNSTLSRRTCL